MVTATPFRMMGSHGHDDHHPAPAANDNLRYWGPPQTKEVDGIVIPHLVDTLEWVLSSPPNVHQFNEPPVSLSYFHFTTTRLLILINFIFVFRLSLKSSIWTT